MDRVERKWSSTMKATRASITLAGLAIGSMGLANVADAQYVSYYASSHYVPTRAYVAPQAIYVAPAPAVYVAPAPVYTTSVYVPTAVSCVRPSPVYVGPTYHRSVKVGYHRTSYHRAVPRHVARHSGHGRNIRFGFGHRR